MAIEYRVGDATRPDLEGPTLVIHCCNDIGAFGAGFANAVARAHPKVKAAYREWAETKRLVLGRVQFVDAAPGLRFGNMIAQHGVRSATNLAPIRYDAMKACLVTVAATTAVTGEHVAGPRFGSRLSGGRWEVIEKLILETFGERTVTIYDPC